MVNYLAVLAAAIGAFAVGALWFTVLFGRVWRREMGVPEGGDMSGMTKSMIGGFVATLILVGVLAYLFSLDYIRTLPTALIIAFFYWLGFIATTMSNMIWYEKRSWTLYCINVFHYLVAIGVATVILSLWW